jgi:hypothetical protein
MKRGSPITFEYKPFIRRSEVGIPLKPYLEEELLLFIQSMVITKVKSRDKKEVIQTIIDDLIKIYENG